MPQLDERYTLTAMTGIFAAVAAPAIEKNWAFGVLKSGFIAVGVGLGLTMLSIVLFWLIEWLTDCG